MKSKDIMQLAITAIIVLAYVYLVILGKAAVEGFAIIATYVIKKFLDIVEVKQGEQK